MGKLISTAPRIGPLKDTRDCSRELARTYKMFRRGELDESTSKTACYLLKTLSSIFRDNDFERRIAELEQNVHART
jgi:hypothetical protein